MARPTDAPDASSKGNREAAAFQALASVLFFASGFAALIYQICWQRALFGWYGIDLDSVSAIVSIFMLGLGAGALGGGWLADRFSSSRVLVFCCMEFVIGLFGIFSLELIDGIGAVLSGFSLPAIVAMTFAMFLLPTTAMGATLPVLVTELTSRTGNVGNATGSLYFINTFGAAVGAYSAAVLLLPKFGLDGAVAVAGGVNIAVACAAAFALFRNTHRSALVAPCQETA